MNKTTVRVCCAVLLLGGALFAPVAAQSPGPAPGVASVGNDWYVPFDPYASRARFRSDIGKGQGYDSGFQSVQGFVPAELEPGRSLIYMDLRGFISNDSDLGANLGVGFRWYDPDVERVWGAGFWYDHDENSFRSYDQVGLSLESLGTYLDLRGNVYIPSQDDETLLGESLTGLVYFFGPNIGLGRRSLVQTALRGGDVEIGGAPPVIGDYGLRTYVGAYYYQGQGTETTTGFKARLEALITEDLSMDVSVADDQLFGTNVFGSVTITLPDGRPTRFFSRQPTRERLYAATERKNRVTIHQHVKNDPLVALRAGGTGGSGGPVGTPIRVFHVDNSAAPGGDGTFENPLNVLPSAGTPGDVDIIFVNRGDGTSDGYDNGIVLGDFQRLLGEGLQHTFTSTRGTFTLPGFTAGPLPIITNTGALNGGNVVTLANFNEVAGFTIGGALGSGDEPLGNGIIGTGINSFNLNNLSIQSPGAAGINITNARGLGTITDVSVTDAFTQGLVFNKDDSFDLDLRLNRVTASRNLDDGFQFNLTNGANALIDIRNSTFNNNAGDGVQIAADNSSFGATIINNTFSNNVGNSINLAALNGSVSASTISANTISASGLSGLMFSSDSGEQLLVIGGTTAADGNTIVRSGESGVFLNLTGTSITTLLAQNNTIAAGLSVDPIRAGFDAGNIPASDDILTSPLTALGFNANFFGQVFSDIFVNNNGNMTFGQNLTTFTPFNLLATNRPIIAPFFADVDTRAGNIVTFGQGTADGRLAFGANYLDVRHFNVNGTNNGLPTNTFQVVLIDRSDINPGDFDIEFNYRDIQWEAGEADGSDPFGLGGTTARVGYSNGVNTAFELPGSGVAGSFINGGTNALISNNINSDILGRYVFEARNGNVNAAPVLGTGNGIRIDMADNSVLRPTITDNTISANRGNGINLTMTQDAVVENLRVQRNTITQNAGNGINFDLNNNARLTQTGLLDANVISNNAQNGIAALVRGNAQLPLLVSNSTIADNALDGFNGRVSGTSRLPVTFDNNNITGSGDDGIDLQFTGNSRGPVSVVNNTISGSTAAGIRLVGSGNTILQGSITDNAIQTNGSYGVLWDESDSRSLLTFSRNLVDGNTDAGLFVRTSGINPAVSSFTITDNTFSNTVDNPAVVDPDTFAEGDGMLFLIRGGATLNPRTFATTITGNTFTTNAGDGARLDVGGTTIFNSIFSDNTATDNLGDGVEINGRGGALLTFLSENNELSGNTGAGLAMTVQSDSIFDMTFRNNLVDSNANGITAVMTNDGILTGLFQQNMISNNLADGVNFNFSSSTRTGLFGTTDVITFDQNLIDDNDDDGVQITATGSGALGAPDIQIDFTNNTISNNTDDGVHIDTLSADAINNFTDNQILDNGGDGIDVVFNTTSNATVGGPVFSRQQINIRGTTVNSSVISGNGGDGVSVVVGEANGSFRDGEDLLFVMNQTSVLRNAGRGVDLEFQGVFANALTVNPLSGNPGGVTITNSIINQNGREGVYLITNSAVHTSNDPFNRPNPAGPTGLYLEQFEDSPNASTATPTYSDNPPTFGFFPFADGFSRANANIGGIPYTSYNDISLSLVGNTIQGNGNVIDSNGVLILVGGNGYVRADVRNTTWSGNSLDDFNTDSFAATDGGLDADGAPTGATIVTPQSQIIQARVANTTPEQRRIFFDDLSRLDLRFTGNGFPPLQPGDSIGAINSFNGVLNAFRNIQSNVDTGIDGRDPLLSGPNALIPLPARSLDFFRVEDTLPGGGSILNTTNVFTQPDSLNPRNNFLNGQYFLVPAFSFGAGFP